MKYVIFAIALVISAHAIASEVTRQAQISKIMEAQGVQQTFQQQLDQSRASASDLGRNLYQQMLSESGIPGLQEDPKLEQIITRHIERRAAIFSATENAEAWARFSYGRDLSEAELDTVLAGFKSSVKKKDVAANRAAMITFSRVMREESQARINDSIGQMVAELKAAIKIAKLNYDLYWAAFGGNQEKVSALIEQGADVNFGFRPDDSKTPLHMAVTYGDAGKLNLKDRSTPPDATIMGKRLKVVKLLIERGANVKATTTQGVTPLHMAATKEISEALIQHGAVVDAQDSTGERLTPLFYATVRHKSVAESLISHGANVNQKAASGDTPLLRATREGNSELIKLLIKGGADVTDKNNSSSTALEFAFQRQDHKTAQLLMDNGATISSQSELGFTELHWAVKQNNLEMARSLLTKGRKVDPVSKDGRTPLLEAVLNDNKPIAELLIKHGANVNFSSANFWNKKPVLFSVRNREMMALMLDHGANTRAVDGDGKDIFYYLQGREDLIAMVKNASNLPNKK